MPNSLSRRSAPRWNRAARKPPPERQRAIRWSDGLGKASASSGTGMDVSLGFYHQGMQFLGYLERRPYSSCRFSTLHGRYLPDGGPKESLLHLAHRAAMATN